MAAAHSPQQKSPLLLLLLLLLAASLPSSAQPPLPRPATKNEGSSTTSYNASVSPTLSILIASFISLLFLLIFFFIYIRFCHTPRSSSVSPTSAIPIPSRQAAAQIRGLDPSLLETFPTMTYSDVKGHHKLGKTPLECAVCLSEFDDRDILRFLPTCSHVFHRDCVDVWLASHVTCPVCRRNLSADDDPSPAAVDREADFADLVRIGSQRRAPLGNSLSRGDWEAVLAAGSGEDGRFRLQLPEDVRREIVEGGRMRRSASLGGSRRAGWVWRSLRLGHSARWPLLRRSMSAAVEGLVKPDEGAEV